MKAPVCLLLLSFLIYQPLVFSAEPNLSPDQLLATLNNRLVSVERRHAAMEKLANYPKMKLELHLMHLVLKRDEPVVLRNIAAQELIKLRKPAIIPALEEAVFKRSAHIDSLAKELALSVLMEITEPSFQETLYIKLVKLVMNRKENAEFRRHILQQLRRVVLLPEPYADDLWAKQLALNNTEDGSVKLAALYYLEGKPDAQSYLEDILPVLLQAPPSQDTFTKEAILLMADRVHLKDFGYYVERILTNPKEDADTRRIALQFYMKYPMDGAVDVLNQLLGKVKEEQLRSDVLEAVEIFQRS
ncbi:MAG: hypothetical protein COV74_10585 [Candidatus Omnitrophica bacterium CG11_big_fil_rev_8_21_14_0_20_45_26]|uniref:HEAT repeat domain-containing protein n=1 Tax=Candidatus Abzuiibacterium crystallinum TaxID=1974748 RepID=A0A2H0LL06_9BACT|nr:MAG: hypothetical protein COV74_10585 [Candidatus Omnitrophica bacterium CG11_big_fil_rev_8_21_14_0_20_45_26]PIW63887.1 MAG: hypothetical protein COW12_08225 [Candidatus Omnitrophica bacterium CG12_big_fil_rev_8_21_14_0_65_45_16]